MPLHPEKLASRQEVRGAITSQFWEQAVQSTRSLDGVTKTLPSEPPPLSQAGPSGLSRTQQLLAAQALSVPALPSYDGSEGGVVRILLALLSYQIKKNRKCTPYKGSSKGHLPEYTSSNIPMLLHHQVLDRVLARTGGESWWAALSSRARVQRMIRSHRRGNKLVRCQ